MLSKLLILTTAALFSLNSLILSPLYTYSCIEFSFTVIPEIIEIVIDILDVITYALCFSIIIYSIFRFSCKGSFHITIIYCAAVFLKYTANLIITFIIDSYIGFSDLWYVLIYFILDLFLLILILSFASYFIKNYYKQKTVLEKANNRLGIKNTSVKEEIFSSGRIFSKKNPLQLSALTMGIIMSVTKILSRIRFDIYVGAPSSLSDTLWMITYYISDILIIPVMYTVAWLVFSHLEKKDTDFAK